MKISILFRQLRQRTGLTQREMAKRFGISQTMVTNLEKAKTETIQKLDEIFETLLIMNRQPFEFISQAQFVEMVKCETELTLPTEQLEEWASDYFLRHKITIWNYLLEYDGAGWPLLTYLELLGTPPKQIEQQLAVRFTINFLRMLEGSVCKIAEDEGVAITKKYRVNGIIAYELHEFIGEEIDSYMSATYGKYTESPYVLPPAQQEQLDLLEAKQLQRNETIEETFARLDELKPNPAKWEISISNNYKSYNIPLRSQEEYDYYKQHNRLSKQEWTRIEELLDNPEKIACYEIHY